MSGAHLNKKITKPVPPDRGSFPLDHSNVCKEKMMSYMECLVKNRNDNAKCRQESKEYLACRMDNMLMAKEEWSYLGFEEYDDNSIRANVTK